MKVWLRYQCWVGPVVLAVPFVCGCIALELARHENALRFDEATAEFDRLRSVVEGNRGRQAPESRQNFSDTRFHDEDDATLVAAAMLSTVKHAAVQRGLGISRSEARQASARAGLQWAGISTEVTGPLAGLYNLIADIEAARPVLIIDEVKIRALGISPANSSSEPALVATFEITGPMNVALPQD